MTIERIIKGNLHFRREILPSLSPLFSKLALQQDPTVLLIACADSRLVPTRILASEPGEVFEVRTVGNLVAPATAGSGLSSGDVSEAAAIEYAAGVLDIKDVVVLGHSSCGAMGALLKGKNAVSGAVNLSSWLEHGAAALQRGEELEYAPGLGPSDRLSQANVLVQMEHVATYPVLRDKVAKGEVEVHGAWLDVGTGDLHLLDRKQRRFCLLDEAEGQRRLG